MLNSGGNYKYMILLLLICVFIGVCLSRVCTCTYFTHSKSFKRPEVNGRVCVCVGGGYISTLIEKSSLDLNKQYFYVSKIFI